MVHYIFKYILQFKNVIYEIITNYSNPFLIYVNHFVKLI